MGLYNIYKYSKSTDEISREDIWRYQREVIRIGKSKNKQHTGKRKKYKKTNNDLQNIHITINIYIVFAGLVSVC